jgi:hypothetical protein
LQYVIVYSLFDITETAVVRSFKIDHLPFVTKTGIEINDEQEWRFRRRQQSNYEILLQVLSLRIQPLLLGSPKIQTNQLLSKYNFDKTYKGKHTVWTLEFEFESTGALAVADDPVGALYQDFNNVPMLKDLTETSQVNGHFNCIERNIYFESVNK